LLARCACATHRAEVLGLRLGGPPVWVHLFLSLFFSVNERLSWGYGCSIRMALQSENINDSSRLSQLREVAEPICAAHGLSLVDIRFSNDHGLILKVLIERPGASSRTGAQVSLEDCQHVSREISTALDVAEGVTPQGNYRLEVGSPGLDRPLFSLADFARFAGETVRVQLHAKVAGRRRFTGKLLGTDGELVKLDQDGQLVTLQHEEIAKANLVHRF
jgi:ribosome maturation factor RimP